MVLLPVGTMSRKIVVTPVITEQRNIVTFAANPVFTVKYTELCMALRVLPASRVGHFEAVALDADLNRVTAAAGFHSLKRSLFKFSRLTRDQTPDIILVAKRASSFAFFLV